MKRFWMFVLLVAGSLAVLTAPAVVMADDENGGDTLESLREDMNTALGTQASRMSDIEKQLGIKLMGDIRIRYAFKSQLNNSADKQGTISDQSYGRYRVRFGATKQFGDFLAGFRLTTALVATQTLRITPSIPVSTIRRSVSTRLISPGCRPS